MKNNMITQDPLVSIIIITFNSAKYILETLESARAQSYQNIELLISDDYSTDDTIEICNQWLEKNKIRFVRTEIIKSYKNTGVPGNCNRGLYSAKGDWVKYIAGDDILEENCIHNYLVFLNGHLGIKAACAKFQCFDTNLSLENISNPKYFGYNNFYSQKKTADQQFKILLRRNFLHGPTFFVSRDLLISLGGFDERYKFEDLPIALNITSKGIKLHFLDKITVYYRINAPSITNAASQTILFSNFYKSKHKFDQDYVFPKASAFLIFFKKYEYYRLLFMEKLGLNRKNLFCRIIYKISYLANPLNIYNTYF